MGYTHYWTRDFTREETVKDFEALLKDVQHVQGIPLANGMGRLGTSPEITDERSGSTAPATAAAKPSACTAYGRRRKRRTNAAAGISARRTRALMTWPSQRHSATSRPSPSRYLTVWARTGTGRISSRDLRRHVARFPRYATILDIPMEILRSDRWCMPWVSCCESSGFDVKFCVDGKGYVEHIKTGDWCCFETHPHGFSAAIHTGRYASRSAPPPIQTLPARPAGPAPAFGMP